MISLLRKPRYLNRGYDFDYYPHSRFYQRYREYGDLSLYFGWPLYSPAITTPVSPYFYDLIPSSDSFRSIRKMIYCSTPISGIDYTYYPETTKYYRPLTLHYNYYYPLRTLNYYSNEWPTYSYWPTYRYYKYLSWPSDRYWFLQRIFDDETRLIRAQSQSLLKRIHTPVPRLQKLFPITTYRYEDALPVRVSNDNYIHRMLTSSPTKASYTTYYTEPVRKYIGQGHLSCVSYAGDRAYNRRRNVWMYEDPMRNDIQLLSYYIQKFRSEKAQEPKIKEVTLSPARPSRRFNANKVVEDTTAQDLKQMKDERAARLAKIYAEEPSTKSESTSVDDAVKAKKKQEEARLAEEKALAEEQARLSAQAKKEEAAKKAELARQEELAAQAAAERAAELEKQAELARQEELAKQAAIEKAKKDEDERLRLEEQKRLEEEAKAEEERQALIRLEEIARQAEEEKEAELVRQAEELAELARQEAELAEQEKKEHELAELARQQAELEDLARQEAELEELERREQGLMEQARQEAEAASKARLEADAAILEAKLAALAQQEQEAELAELDRQQAELEAAEEQAAEEEEAPQQEAAEAEEPEEEQEPEEVQEEDEIIEDEEEPHAIAEDVPEAQASDVEDAVEEEEAQDE